MNNPRPIDELNFLINNSREQSDALRTIAIAMENAAIRAVQGWRYDPPAHGPISFPVLISISDGADAAAASVAPTVAPAGGIRTDGALRVGGAIRTPVKVKDVRPVYPPEAQAARVTGVVILEARIGEDGAVEDARVLRSIPMLDQAAVDAVMQWRFRPTLLNGKPTAVIMTVTVNFTMQVAARERRMEVAPEGGGTGNAPDAANRQDAPVAAQQSPVVVKDVKPKYTREAMDAGVQGSVEVEALIGTDGHVIDAKVLNGHPMLERVGARCGPAMGIQAHRRGKNRHYRDDILIAFEAIESLHVEFRHNRRVVARAELALDDAAVRRASKSDWLAST